MGTPLAQLGDRVRSLTLQTQHTPQWSGRSSSRQKRSTSIALMSSDRCNESVNNELAVAALTAMMGS